jgi:pimeloyl-ACP methyl ester carboxylesterase
MFVILPGLLCDSRMFRAQLDGFANSMCIDGFYPSCTSLEDMAAYALEHMPDRCTVLGHSMGARVALEVLRLAPERVERLILADTGVHPLRAGERKAATLCAIWGGRRGSRSWLMLGFPDVGRKEQIERQAGSGVACHVHLSRTWRL